MSSQLACEFASHRSAVQRADMAARLEDHESTLLTGSKGEVEASAVAFLMSALELTTALADQADEILKLWGLDPATRPQ